MTEALRSWPVPDEALSFDELEGIGRKLCAGVGFAVSNGGALRTDLGMEATGWACKTSLYRNVSIRRDVKFISGKKRERITQLEFGSRNLHQTPSSLTASIRRQRFKKTISMRFRKSMIC